MKGVSYSSTQKLGCGEYPADVILCVDPDLMAGGVPFLEAQVTSAICCNSACEVPIYKYTLTYDESALVDPVAGIQSCDITGIFCDGCMAAYMRYRTSPFVSPTGDPYIYMLPAGPPPIPNGQPFALDIVSVIGNTVTLGWHSVPITP